MYSSPAISSDGCHSVRPAARPESAADPDAWAESRGDKSVPRSGAKQKRIRN
jgi:hypothetical protein